MEPLGCALGLLCTVPKVINPDVNLITFLLESVSAEATLFVDQCMSEDEQLIEQLNIPSRQCVLDVL